MCTDVGVYSILIHLFFQKNDYFLEKHVLITAIAEYHNDEATASQMAISSNCTCTSLSLGLVFESTYMNITLQVSLSPASGVHLQLTCDR